MTAGAPDLHRPPSDEDADNAELARLLKGLVRRETPPGAVARRDAHPKHHACVRAHFTVSPEVPEDLRHGLFARPATYPAWLRLSNGFPKIQSDTKSDQRGFAIKLMGVAGEKVLDDERTALTQDFVLASAPCHFIRTLGDYVGFARAATVPPAIRVATFFFGWNPFRWRLYELRALIRGLSKTRDLLTTTYYSQTPYRLGPLRVKYIVRPTTGLPEPPPGKTPDFLRDRLRSHLERGDATFDFLVQCYVDEERTPIEDSTVEWDEAAAPPQKVATIRIPAQPFDTPQQMALAEHLSFTPWHSLPDHAPIGWMNRTRREVYRAVSILRHEMNGVVRREPTGVDDMGGIPVSTEASVSTPPLRRLSLVRKVALAAVVVGAAWLAFAVAHPPAKDLPAPLPPVADPSGGNGLNKEERQEYYHLTEGGELFPMSWLLALEVAVPAATGQTIAYRPFLENIERFGLLPDAPGPQNPYGLPVGVTMGKAKDTGQQMMGLNCTACHVGEIRYHGRKYRIDGGPNMVYINQFVLSMLQETQHTLESPGRLKRFIERQRRVRLVPLPNHPGVDVTPDDAGGGSQDEDLVTGRHDLLGRWRSLKAMLTTNRGLVEARVQALRNAPMLQATMKASTLDGFGRADAFGVGRNELFGGVKVDGINVNAVGADAPVSFPHLWDMQYTGWLQWGANTNSVIERNVGQALGVGALVDPATWNSTVRIDHGHRMEELSYKLTPPVWPEDILGKIDLEKAARGKAIFDRTCALCHESFKKNGALKEYQLFPLNVVGTDPNTALNFEKTVITADQVAMPFPSAAFAILQNVVRKYYADNHVSPDVQRVWENRAVRGDNQVFRATLLESEQWPDTWGRKVYRAKTLRGIWATAPFLHNGSVPTVYDLLLPASERPRRFVLGTREYDPVKLGYQTSPAHFIVPAGMTPTTLDTTIQGNWNTGHEWWFYPSLDDTKRYEIIEFLKTFTSPSDYQFERPPDAALPCDVRASYPPVQRKTAPVPAGPGTPIPTNCQAQ